MKYLGKIKSKSGHNRLDYLVTLTVSEMKALKMILRRTKISFLEKGDGKEVLKNGHNEINRVISHIK